MIIYNRDLILNTLRNLKAFTGNLYDLATAAADMIETLEVRQAELDAENEYLSDQVRRMQAMQDWMKNQKRPCSNIECIESKHCGECWLKHSNDHVDRMLKNEA